MSAVFAEPPLSASQMGLYDRCPKRWGFVYLEGRREPEHEAAEDGKEVHAMLEAYLRDGVVPDPNTRLGATAHEMLRHLPARGSVKDVELDFELEVQGIRFRGRVDARTPGVVYDHKSTGNMKAAVKTEEELETDLQALIYARWMNEDGELQWTYGERLPPSKKGKPKSKKVCLRVVKEDVERKFDEIVLPLAREILDAYRHNDITLLPKHLGSCHMFPPNGCPFDNDNDCKITDQERIRFVMGDRIPLAEKLRARKAAMLGENTNVVAVPKADPINPPRVAASPVAPVKPRQPKPVLEAAPEPPSPQPEPESLALAPPQATEVAPPPVIVSRHAKPIKTLYCDCLPLTSSKVVHAHILIAAAANEVQNDTQTHHVLLMDFAKGGPSLAAQLQADLFSLPEQLEDVVLVTRTPEGRAVQQVMCALAENVVMAL